jgi:hypothetical protein
MEQVSSNTAKMRRYRARLKERGLHRTPEVRAANNARMKAWNAKWRRTANCNWIKRHENGEHN